MPLGSPQAAQVRGTRRLNGLTPPQYGFPHRGQGQLKSLSCTTKPTTNSTKNVAAITHTTSVPIAIKKGTPPQKAEPNQAPSRRSRPDHRPIACRASACRRRLGGGLWPDGSCLRRGFMGGPPASSAPEPLGYSTYQERHPIPRPAPRFAEFRMTARNLVPPSTASPEPPLARHLRARRSSSAPCRPAAARLFPPACLPRHRTSGSSFSGRH